MGTSAMEQAVYFSTGSVTQEKWCHYGLALDKYTHFTSPIRRYADILVHRLLLAAISLSEVTPTTSEGWWDEVEDSSESETDRTRELKSPDQQMSNVELQELCEHINSRNRAAQRAQRDSQTLFQTLYFKDKPMSDPKCVTDAVIFSLRDNGFLVYIPQYAIKGPVYLESKEKEVLFCGKLGPIWQRGVVTRRDNFVKVETLEGTNMYRLFDHVTVGIQLKGNDVHANVLSFTLLDNQPFNKDETSDGSDSKINFLQEAKLEQVQNVAPAEDFDEDSMEDISEPSEKKMKKSKVNIYHFFQDMQQMGLRPLDNKD